MMPPAENDLRVLIHAPVGRDGYLIQSVLDRVGIQATACPTLEQAADELKRGAGALVVADDSLRRDGVAKIAEWTQMQPRWSDLPILVMTTGGDPDQTSLYRLRLIEPLGNVTLIERPIRKVTLISAVQSALRARQRQYELRAHVTELQRSEARLREAIEQAPIPIMIHAGDGEVLYLSQAWTESSGYSLQDVPTMQAWADLAFGGNNLALLDVALNWPDDMTTRHGWEAEIIAKDGSTRLWVFSMARLTGLADGRKLLVSAAMDITERNAIMDALRLANEDLEQFAYAAAHDLQEPIRNVSLYTQLLAKHSDGKLDTTATEYVHNTVENARRMQNLIHDLLAYTRVVSNRENSLETDCNKVLDEVLQNLRTAIEVAQGIVTHDHLPSVCVPAPQLTQLFQNLISNALKYRGDKPPRIHVSAERDDKDWVFTVADNGVGIPAQHRERIFKVFKRLHGRDIPGTGIGLAICQRVVTHYGGRIWVESIPGDGSAFRFTFPAKKGPE